MVQFQFLSSPRDNRAYARTHIHYIKETNNGQKHTISFNAARSSGIYGAAAEVRPKNRNYLPIIKY